jgi:peptidoglycan/LPS O-acetylase OafA/YrhL
MTPPTTQLLHPKYRPDIDGLRAIAVMSVVFFHAFPTSLKGGFTGVDVFFVISGFLISTIVFQNLYQGTFSFSEFYIRRVKRIFPALGLVLFFCLLFASFSLLPDELNQLGKHVFAGAGFASNFLLWSESGYFDNSAETKPLLHLWSLGIEEQFYIIWPLLLWAAWKIRLNLFVLTVFLLCSSLVINIWLVYQDPIATFYSPLTRFWELLCGALLAWVSLQHSNSNFSDLFKTQGGAILPWLADPKNKLVISNLCALIGIALLIFGFFFVNKELSFPGYWALVPVIGTVLIISSGPQAWINRKILSHKVLVWIGLISFPLYLWHWPILSFLRIVYFETPPLKFRLFAVIASILLAWITMKFIEKPLRFGTKNPTLKLGVLLSSLVVLALSGIIVNNTNFSDSHSLDKLSVKRRGEHAIGSSLAWYQGKEDWLFLGNAHDNIVAKLKLAIKPSEAQLNEVKESFSKFSEAGAKFGIPTVLIIGPNKSSIYPEYLPDGLIPSEIKYSSLFLNMLRGLPSLIVYDPTADLVEAKRTEGILYWKTDTHWNHKGAYLAYAGFSKQLKLPIPDVDFKQGSTYSGHLLETAKLKDFQLHNEDNWDVVWKEKPEWTEQEIPNEKKTTFGASSIVTNENSLTKRYVWVVGDSFTPGLKPYFNASFREVRYIGHWVQKLKDLPGELNKADRKPDLIVVVRVERSF